MAAILSQPPCVDSFLSIALKLEVTNGPADALGLHSKDAVKMSYQNRNFHDKDKIVRTASYLYNGKIPIPRKMVLILKQGPGICWGVTFNLYKHTLWLPNWLLNAN